MSPRFFGSDTQKRMERVAHDLWPLFKDDPAYATEGRIIGIDAPSENQIDKVAALTRIQGASVNHYVPKAEEDALAARYVGLGLASDRWDQFMGGPACLEASTALIERVTLPKGYTLHRLSPDTPAHLLDGLETTAAACGVLPPMSPILFGELLNAAYFCLEAPDGGVAACAGSVMRNHPDSRFGKTAWWGMLATREQDRGHGLSLYLGALSARHMHDHHGVTEFYTGVRSDNAVSRHVCEKLGLHDSAYACVAILDPQAFGEGGYTK